MDTIIGEHISYIMWADGKILEDEWSAAEKLFKKYDLNWDDGKVAIQNKINDLMECENAEDESEDSPAEYDETFEIPSAVPPEGVDGFELLKDLAQVALADGELSLSELDIMHRLGKSFKLSRLFVSAAIIEAVINSDKKINVCFN